jgi:transposase
MDVVHPRCAGIDISKRDAKVCVRIQGRGNTRTTSTVTTWGAMSNQILTLREHLLTERVSCVVMEATGDYWKPYFYLLEDALTVMLVNAHDARNMPGRKTDLCPTPHGWPTWAHTGCCAGRWCRRNRSGNCATSPAPARP